MINEYTCYQNFCPNGSSRCFGRYFGRVLVSSEFCWKFVGFSRIKSIEGSSFKILICYINRAGLVVSHPNRFLSGSELLPAFLTLKLKEQLFTTFSFFRSPFLFVLKIKIHGYCRPYSFGRTLSQCGPIAQKSSVSSTIIRRDTEKSTPEDSHHMFLQRSSTWVRS